MRTTPARSLAHCTHTYTYLLLLEQELLESMMMGHHRQCILGIQGGVVKPPDEALLLTAYIMIPAQAGPSGFDNNGRQANGTYIGLGDPPPSPQPALWAQYIEVASGWGSRKVRDVKWETIVYCCCSGLHNHHLQLGEEAQPFWDRAEQ